IFLLLIFFMLTSNLVIPSGLPVNLPTSKPPTEIPPPAKVHLTISSGLEYFINDRKVLVENLEAELKKELNPEENVVVLHIDESVDVKYFVEAAGIAASLGAKLSIATLPETK
ncbi:MAG TPA: biopolymer transporter ExbD, partial [Cytophagaceae bacterium]